MRVKERDMKSYRVALIEREFPFLNKIFDRLRPQDVDDIKIRRGDSSLLAQKPQESSYSWSGGGYHDYTMYCAVWREGNEFKWTWVKNAVSSARGNGSNYEEDADPVGAQLFGLGLNPEYIVECVQNDTDANGNGRLSRSWTVYKMPGFDLAAYHAAQIDEAATTLKAEIAAACAEK